MTELPTPREFLDSELAKRHITQNELGRLMRPGKSGSSHVSKFASGTAGPQICITLARTLNVDPTYVLAIAGHTDIDNMADDADIINLQYLFNSMSRANKALLLDFARLLKEHEG